MVDLKKIIRDGVLPVIVGATLVAGPIGCGEGEMRTGLELRESAIAYAMERVGDTTLSNYLVRDSCDLGDCVRYRVYHSDAQPLNNMSIRVPKNKRKKPYLVLPD